MKNIIKISSLALVAILASCSNTTNVLKKISPSDAVKVATAIASERRVEKLKERQRNHEIDENALISGDHFPYTAKKMSADITIRHTNNISMPALPFADVNDETIIKKHIFFDMEKLFYQCHISMTYKSNEDTKITYPDVDYYAFFIEDKEQEETVETEYQKTGNFYVLSNTSNIKKTSLLNVNETKGNLISTRLINKFTDSTPLFNPNLSPSFNTEAALSYGLSSPTINWNIMNSICTELEVEVLPTDSHILIMPQWFSWYFYYDLVPNCEALHDTMENLNDGHSYFNYTFESSDDLKSLGINTDVYKWINQEIGPGSTVQGYQQEISSIIFKDLYLSESHIEIKNNADITSDSTGSMHSDSSTSCDQYLKYDTNEQGKIPEDYLEYTMDL